jgi:hypothetical protein
MKNNAPVNSKKIKGFTWPDPFMLLGYPRQLPHTATIYIVKELLTNVNCNAMIYLIWYKLIKIV